MSKKQEADPKRISKLMYAFTTFDGGVYRTDGAKHCSYAMNIRKANLDYAEWVASTLRTFVGVRIDDRKVDISDGCLRAPQVRVQSRTHPRLSKLREAIYQGSRKTLCPHLLAILDEEVLAIIFMADGAVSMSKNGQTVNSLTLNTKGFTYAENFLLKKALKDRLGLEFNVQKQKRSRGGYFFYLRLRNKDLRKFYLLVRDFVLHSFDYKLERLTPHLEDDDIVRSL